MELNRTAHALAILHIVQDQMRDHNFMKIVIYFTAGLIVLVNASIAIAFIIQKYRHPAKVQLNPSGLLVLNLLFADTLLGSIVISDMATFANKTMIQYRYWCSIRMGLCYMAVLGSYIALINVIVDRYMAIQYTFHHRDWMTLKRSLGLVASGWLIALTGLFSAIAFIDWAPVQVFCLETDSFKQFQVYVYAPSHAVGCFCVVALQCCVYLCLRRHDAKRALSNQVHLRYSEKSAKILCWIITPTGIAMICYDVNLIIITLWINQTLVYITHVILLFVFVCLLMNPIVYSYATTNIRKPVSDLCGDIRNWLTCTGQ